MKSLPSQLSLPIDGYRAEILRHLAGSAPLLIEAPPGTGKTTRVPQFLAGALPGKILVLEPRRLAARLAAERVASEVGTAVGDAVGYHMRFDRRVSAATRIVFITEGMFPRLLRSNPFLDGVSAVIIDEFHERNVQSDVALALIRALRAGPRPDLQLLIMSATLDMESLATALGALVVSVSGRRIAVEVEYCPRLASGETVSQHVARAIHQALAQRGDRGTRENGGEGNVLAFLPGLQWIRDAQRDLTQLLQSRPLAHLGGKWEILPLSSELSAADQSRVFAPSSARKIILATNVAETSLTLPDITLVIDSGLAKISGTTAWNGLPTLEVRPISQASCIQRAGRAGRTAPGRAIRLFAEHEFEQRSKQLAPEILRVDAAGWILDLLSVTGSIAKGAGASIASVLALPFLTLPDEQALGHARVLLLRLGAIATDGALTPRGVALCRVPLHPRLAAMATEELPRDNPDEERAGQKEAAPGLDVVGLAAAALLAEGMWQGGGPPPQSSDSDILWQVERLAATRPGDGRDPVAARAQRLFRACGGSGLSEAIRADAAHDRLTAALLRGFPDRVARLVARETKGREQNATYHFCLGGSAVLSPRSAVAGEHGFIIALSARETLAATRQSETIFIETAVAIGVDDLNTDPGKLIAVRRVEEYAAERQRIEDWEVTTYGEIELNRRRLPPREESRGGDARAIAHGRGAERDGGSQLFRALVRGWPRPFSEEDIGRYHSRLALLTIHNAAADLFSLESDDELLEIFQSTLAETHASVSEIARTPLVDHIASMVSADGQEALKAAPEKLRLRNGKTLPVQYPDHGVPVLEGLMQDFFGLTEHPTLIHGRVCPQIRICGPNRRPLQTTDDLANFWRSGYETLAASLRRRHPRHYWPEAPAQAKPFLLLRHVAAVPK